MARLLHPKKYAWFTPSVSQMYVLAHAKGWPRQPINFDKLNFVDHVNDKANGGFHFWPANLYSAGHAHLDPVKSDEREPMIQGRNREHTVLVGDSGGFQAATGVLEFDWDNPLGQKAIEQRLELMRWLEHTADYSMVLDWPAWAIPTGRLPTQLETHNPATGEKVDKVDESTTFKHCLDGTVWNNEFFIKNRTVNADGTKPTKFLNVLQGRTVPQAIDWYNRVTPFSDTSKYGDRAFEGWALGGATGGDPSLTMKLLVMLRRDGLLNGPDRWIHVLGRSRLSTAVYLAALNESLSRNLNPGIQISYDASSAFLYAVNGNYVTDFACSPKGLNLVSAEWPMHPKYIKQADKVAFLDRLKNDYPNWYDQLIARYGIDSIMEDAGAQQFLYWNVDKRRMEGKDGVTECAFEMETHLPPHFKSQISQDEKMKMEEFILAPEFREGDKATWSKDEWAAEEKRLTKGFRMDTASYYYIMSHNVEMQCHAVEWVCDKLFSGNPANYLPSIFLEFKQDVDELFKTHKPWTELTQEEQDFYTAKSLEMCGGMTSDGGKFQKYSNLISGERMGYAEHDGIVESNDVDSDAQQKKKEVRDNIRKKKEKVVVKKPVVVQLGELFAANGS